MTELDGRAAAVRRYADRYDHFATEEQVLLAEGRFAESQGAAWYAAWLLRAYRGELNCPKSKRNDCDDCEQATADFERQREQP